MTCGRDGVGRAVRGGEDGEGGHLVVADVLDGVPGLLADLLELLEVEDGRDFRQAASRGVQGADGEPARAAEQDVVVQLAVAGLEYVESVLRMWLIRRWSVLTLQKKVSKGQ